MSRMFLIDGKPMKTWNIFIGCSYECSFCNAKKVAETRLRHIPRYSDGFKPKFVEKELARRFKPGEFVFIAYMGDIAFATREQVLRILERIRQFPETSFLFCSKDPDCYWKWEDNGVVFPLNLYLGATIETTRDYALTKAPSPRSRYLDLALIDHPKKFVAIEPIMDFHLATLVEWMKDIKPKIIEVGADNYGNHLVEPPWWKVEMLLEILKAICPRVVAKEGLERLRGEA